MPDPFATAGELAGFLGIPEPSDLARWQRHLASASALVRGYCGQELSAVQGDVVDLLPNASSTLFLPQVPVTDVSSVVLGGTGFTSYGFTSTGELYRTDGGTWTETATVTYDHGFAEFSSEYEAIKLVVLEAAGRAITLNERSASEAMGSTVMESVGYAPEIFLTQGERFLLGGLSRVGVG